MQSNPTTPLAPWRLFIVTSLAAILAWPIRPAAQVLGPPGSAAAGAATMPAPSIDVAKVLTPLGLTPQGAIYAKKKHQEIMAATKDGRMVRVAFDWTGRVKSITDANRRKGGIAAGLALPTTEQLSSNVRAAGFEPLGVVETKKHHFVMRARNQQREMLDLHIDFGGTIYKQVWLR
jgi:hypothetical protein